MKKILNISLSILFFMIIFLPWLFAHRIPEGRSSDMENRMLAGYPAIITEDGINKSFPQEYENWLEDNIRGRSILVELNSTLQYKLFHRVVKSDTLQGRNGWLFLNREDMIEEFQNLDLVSQDKLEHFAAQMQLFSNHLEEKEIAFYYMPCYNKETIYPQEYAEGIIQQGNTSRCDQIVNILLDETDIHLIQTKESLLAAAAEEEIYYKYVDLLHWNERGAYIGYRALMDAIQKDFDQVYVLEESDYLIENVQRDTYLYGYLYPYVEYSPKYTPINAQAAEITEQTQERWQYLKYKEHTHDFTNESCENDLKLLLIGDSYFRQFLMEDFAESFSATLSIDWLNIPLIDEIIEDYQPDIVVLENVEMSAENIMDIMNEMKFK